MSVLRILYYECLRVLWNIVQLLSHQVERFTSSKSPSYRVERGSASLTLVRLRLLE